MSFEDDSANFVREIIESRIKGETAVGFESVEDSSTAFVTEQQNRFTLQRGSQATAAENVDDLERLSPTGAATSKNRHPEQSPGARRRRLI